VSERESIGKPYHTRRRMTSRRLVKLKSAV
jgi:hypothetical protein